MDVTRDSIEEIKKAYERVFGESNDPSLRIVMNDLKRFCRVDRTCFHPDPRLHAVAEGRREVALRIFDHLSLSVDQLYDRQQKQKKGIHDA